VKDRPQIYVICFLIGVKMKKIVFLYFTFLGICTASAQKPVEIIPLDSLGRVAKTNSQRGKNDSLPGKEKPLIRLSPNPSVNKIEIELKGFDPGDVQIHITDINGNTVKKDKRLVFGGDEIIVLMFSISRGIYLLQVSQNKKQARAKFIVR
jgi:Secretion system C-terminal sorting domain